MERRTILFVDQVGSTRRLADIGDEAMVEIRNRLWDIVRSTADAHGGRVFSDEGDGGAVVFASPDAGAAAALRLVRDGSAGGIELRVGLHDGPVVPNGSGFVGLTVHVAARLCDVAPSGHVVASESFAREIADGAARTTEFGQRSLKGLSEPVAVVLLSDIDADPPESDLTADTIRGAPLTSSPLLARSVETMLGRGIERAALLTGTHRHTDDEVRLVTVGGQPGTGKTTLVHHVCRELVDAGAVCLIGRADEGTTDPFHELIEMLAPLIAQAPLPLLADHVLRHGDLLTRLLPGLGDRVPSAARQADDREVPPDRRRLFEAVADLVRATSALRDVVLLFEDVHWGTSPSLDMFRHLARSAALGPVTLIVTYRTTDVEPGSIVASFLQRVSAEPNHTDVQLGPLDQATIRALTDRQFPELAATQPDAVESLADRVFRQTGGNALFCTEMLRSLATDSLAVLELTDQDLPLPATIHDITQRRVDRLGAATADVLVDAAVLGENFSLVELRTVTPIGTDALDALDRGERAGLIRPSSRSGREFSFTHAVVQRALYDGMTTSERLRRHRRVADALQSEPTSRAADLLSHLQRSGALATELEIAAAAAAAADEASERLALVEAVAFHQTAVDALDSAALTGTAPDPTHRATAMLALGLSQTAIGLSAGKSSLIAAAAFAKQADDWHLFGEIATQYGGTLKENQAPMTLAEPIALITEALEHHVEASPLRARLLSSLALWQRETVPYAERRPLVDEAIDIVRSFGDPATMVPVLAEAHRGLHGPDAAHDALGQADELESLAAELGDDGALFQALNLRILAANELGDIEQAGVAADQLATVGARMRHIEGRRITLMWQALNANIRGDNAAVRSHSTDLRGLLIDYPEADLLRFAFAIEFVPVWLGGNSEALYEIANGEYGREPTLAWFAADSGQLDLIAGHLAASVGVEGVDRQRAYMWWHDMVAFARAARGLGDARLARQVRESMLPHRHHNAVMGLVAFLGAADHHLGTVAAVCGDLDDAVEHFEAAITRHTDMGAVPFLALTRAELADVLLTRGAQGDAARAATLRRQAAAVADEMKLGLVHRTLAESAPG